MAIVVIDPGHGGTKMVGGSSPNNATGPKGLLEKTVTLQIAFATEAALKPSGHQIILTRREDVNVGIADRTKFAKSRKAPVFVSIHLNAPAENGSPAQGTETWVGTGYSAISMDLAKRVQARVVAATGYADRKVKEGKVSGVIMPGNHHKDTANCLCEVSFLSKAPEEETRLKNPAYINSLGQAIANAIVDHLATRVAPPMAGSGMVQEGTPAPRASKKKNTASKKRMQRPKKTPKRKKKAPVKKKKATRRAKKRRR